MKEFTRVHSVFLKRHRALTGSNVAKQKKFSSAYLLAIIQIFFTGSCTSISRRHRTLTFHATVGWLRLVGSLKL